MSVLAIAMGALILAITGWQTLSSRHPRGWALAGAVAVSTFVPLYAAPRNWILASTVTILLLLFIAALRSPAAEKAKIRWVIPATVGFVIITRLAGALSIGFSPTDALTGLVLLGVLLVGRHLTEDDLDVLGKVLGTTMIFHVCWAAGELFLGFAPLFPMGDGSTDIADRPNAIFPELPGRPMTSFSHPIPLANFAIFVGVLAFYLARTRKRWLYWLVVAASLVTIALSGTRSAVLSFVAAGIVLVVATSKMPLFLRGLLTVIALSGATLSAADTRVMTAIGLGSDFLDSGSYLHRSAILGSFWRLFDRDAEAVLFGSGTNREMIFQNGIVQGYLPGAYFFDNQYVATLAMYGLIAFALFIAVNLYVLLRGGGLERALMLALIAMGFSFDFLLHFTSAITWALVIAMTRAFESDRTGAHLPTVVRTRDLEEKLTARR